MKQTKSTHLTNSTPIITKRTVKDKYWLCCCNLFTKITTTTEETYHPSSDTDEEVNQLDLSNSPIHRPLGLFKPNTVVPPYQREPRIQMSEPLLLGDDESDKSAKMRRSPSPKIAP